MHGNYEDFFQTVNYVNEVTEFTLKEEAFNKRHGERIGENTQDVYVVGVSMILELYFLRN